MEAAEVVVEESVTPDGFSVATARPDGTVVARFTVPENPLEAATVIVDVPEDPELIVNGIGLAPTLKLGASTVTATFVEWEVDELLAVTVTP